jgi:hypothetical protein
LFREVVDPAAVSYNSSMNQSSYDQFEATSLYCPQCRVAGPVRKKLLLILPDGEEYEYLCARCATSVGTKTEKNAPPVELLYRP